MNWNEFNFEGLANALLLLIVGVAGLFGWGKTRKGKAAGPATETVELAGAVISDRVADRLANSMDALAASNTMLTHAANLDTEAKGTLTKALIANVAMMERLIDSKREGLDIIKGNTHAANAVATRAHELSVEVGGLAKEMEIASRMRRQRDE